MQINKVAEEYMGSSRCGEGVQPKVGRDRVPAF